MQPVYDGCDIKTLTLLKPKKDKNKVVGSNEYGIWTDTSFMMYASLYPTVMTSFHIDEKTRVNPS